MDERAGGADKTASIYGGIVIQEGKRATKRRRNVVVQLDLARTEASRTWMNGQETAFKTAAICRVFVILAPNGCGGARLRSCLNDDGQVGNSRQNDPDMSCLQLSGEQKHSVVDEESSMKWRRYIVSALLGERLNGEENGSFAIQAAHKIH